MHGLERSTGYIVDESIKVNHLPHHIAELIHLKRNLGLVVSIFNRE